MLYFVKHHVTSEICLTEYDLNLCSIYIQVSFIYFWLTIHFYVIDFS